MILLTRISYSSLVVEHLDLGPDYKMYFSLGWNFASPTGLKYCCNYMLNFSLRAERKFTEVQNHNRCACSRSFSSPGLIKWWRLKRLFRPFARADNPRNRARILRPGWNLLHVIAFHFKRISFKSRSENWARLTWLKFAMEWEPLQWESHSFYLTADTYFHSFIHAPSVLAY